MGKRAAFLSCLLGVSGLVGCGTPTATLPIDVDSPQGAQDSAQGAQRDEGARPEQELRANVLRYPLSVAETVEACARPGRTSPASTADELSAAVVGRWLLCSDAPFYGHGEVGIEFGDDGSWDLLFVENDTFVTKDGPAFRGRWSLTDAGTGRGGPLAIGVSGDGFTGTWIYQPEFALDPAQMIIEHSGERVRFSALPLSETSAQGQKLPPPSLKPTPGYADNLCAPFEGTYAWSSRDELGAAVLGRWLLCADAPFFFRENEAGVEFRADGTWHLLFAEQGAFVTSQGPGLWGHWEFTDNGTGSGGDLAIGLTVANQSSGTFIYRPEFARGRAQMKLRDARFSALAQQ